MASHLEFVEYVVDQLSLAGEITYKKMFGEYGIYCQGKFFAMVCDDCFFVKMTDEGKALLGEYETASPYEGAKPSFLISELEDREKLAKLTQVTCMALPDPKPKKKRGE